MQKLLPLQLTLYSTFCSPTALGELPTLQGVPSHASVSVCSFAALFLSPVAAQKLALAQLKPWRLPGGAVSVLQRVPFHSSTRGGCVPVAVEPAAMQQLALVQLTAWRIPGSGELTMLHLAPSHSSISVR